MKTRMLRRCSRANQTVRLTRKGDLEPVRAILPMLTIGQDLLTVGANDARWFETVAPGTELIPFEIPKGDILTISSTLFSAGIKEGKPDVANLGLRFPHFRTAPSKGGTSTP